MCVCATQWVKKLTRELVYDCHRLTVNSAINAGNRRLSINNIRSFYLFTLETRDIVNL